ncbi:type IV pilin protein [Nocardioides cheoyonin]|uniref:type IV pilin protein n=1 Tax=Nocardioides cheoyonin TaxID=3156615 RepID=UPI0032B4EDD2
MPNIPLLRRHHPSRPQRHYGFTLVELLIVIVVIAILAAISLVAYNGIQNRAHAASAASAARQAADKISVYYAENGTYPDMLYDVDVKSTDSTTFTYLVEDTGYCVQATDGGQSAYVSSTQSSATSGTCPAGANLVAWNEPDSSSAPIDSPASVDTSTYRTAPASEKVPVQSTGVSLRGMPLAVSAGDLYTVSFYLKTDSDWDGKVNNSKVRFANGDGGSLLKSCSYNGVKTNWTLVTCGYTVASGITSLGITVGNDGTTGNIWIDDVTVTKS